MIQTPHVSLRAPLLAPLAALLFCGCSGAEVPESSGSDSAPSTTAPSNAASSNTAPSNTTPSNTAPSNTTPSNTAPSNTTPSNTTPSNTTPSNTTPSNTTPAGADTNGTAGTTPPSASEPSAEEAASNDEPPPSGGQGQSVDEPMAQPGAAAVSLGAAASFALLGSSTVTCTNSSEVTGDVGVSPGIAITGFDASCTLTGSLHAQDAVATAAHADLVLAFDELGAAECEVDLTGVELGGLTLAPAVYCFDTTAGVTGALTLDAGQDPNGVWIFQVGSAITTAPGSTVALAGGGDACNVFWRVGSSAVLGTNSSFKGNILTAASVTLASGSSLEGRALARDAAVTSDGNVVSGCGG